MPDRHRIVAPREGTGGEKGPVQDDESQPKGYTATILPMVKELDRLKAEVAGLRELCQQQDQEIQNLLASMDARKQSRAQLEIQEAAIEKYEPEPARQEEKWKELEKWRHSS